MLAANLRPETQEQDRQALSVPLPDVNQDVWVSFVRTFINPTRIGPTGVTKHFRYGVFEMTVRRLADLGVMTNVRSFRTKPKGPQGTPQLVWSAEWVPPLNLRGFLADPMYQYRLFAESVQRYSTEEPLRQAVGMEVDGKISTLSGLLGVAHRGGLSGLQSWLKTPKQRAKFTDTTDAYCRANGLF